MSKIIIKKSPTADTRTCDVSTVSKEQLIESSLAHIGDVRKGMFFWCQLLMSQASQHDHTKLSGIDHFFSDFKTSFKEHAWYDNHKKVERHHIGEGAPDDVTLIDVFEYITDCIMAGKARSGVLYPIKIDPAVLMRAFDNSVKIMTDEVEVEE
jgi:hypothetical protein